MPVLLLFKCLPHTLKFNCVCWAGCVCWVVSVYTVRMCVCAVCIGVCVCVLSYHLRINYAHWTINQNSQLDACPFAPLPLALPLLSPILHLSTPRGNPAPAQPPLPLPHPSSQHMPPPLFDCDLHKRQGKSQAQTRSHGSAWQIQLIRKALGPNWAVCLCVCVCVTL